MSWQTLFQNEHVSLVLDSNQRHCMLEVNSGGFQPKYVSLHLDEKGLEQLIGELQKAKTALQALT